MPQADSDILGESTVNDNVTRPTPSATSASPSARRSPTSRLTIPPQLKAVFDRFPIHVYPSNNLPLRSPSTNRQEQLRILHIFTTPEAASSGAPSYNPSCLKWQTLLKFHHIAFTIQASNNHAAPGGALPFLTIPPSNTGASAQPIPSSKLETYIHTHSNSPHQQHHRSDHKPHRQSLNPFASTYNSLIVPLRLAYTHALYLHEPTFQTLAKSLYIDPASCSPFVRLALEPPLRAAALEQLVLGAPGMGGGGIGVRVDVEGLYTQAEEAVEALSQILGGEEWFGAAVGGSGGEVGGREQQGEGPGVLDAAVFAYIHVLLEWFTGQEEGSYARRLVDVVERRGNLVEHRGRVLREFYGQG